jgi:hypothetical protein
MKCEQFQNQLMQDPSCEDDDFIAHREQCAPCAREWKQAQEFEAILRTAISVKADKLLEVKHPRRRTTSWWQQTWVRAASVALLIGASVAGFNLAQQLFSAENLPQLVVHHIQKEPEMLNTRHVLDEMELMTVLSPQGFDLVEIPGTITAAAPCWIRKGRGMHLVLRGESGPVTVLLMPGEYAQQQAVVSASLSGMLIPTGWGSMAVVSHAGEDIQPLVHSLQQDVRWKGMLSTVSF